MARWRLPPKLDQRMAREFHVADHRSSESPDIELHIHTDIDAPQRSSLRVSREFSGHLGAVGSDRPRKTEGARVLPSERRPGIPDCICACDCGPDERANEREQLLLPYDLRSTG